MATRTTRYEILDQIVTFAIENCINCGIHFGIPSMHKEQRQDDGKTFYCPNGHGMVYRDTAAVRLQRAQQEVDELRERVAGEERRLEAERRYHAATKGQLTRIRNRIQNGVCPECNRHFVNLEQHMTGQHPKTQADAARAARATKAHKETTT